MADGLLSGSTGAVERAKASAYVAVLVRNRERRDMVEKRGKHDGLLGLVLQLFIPMNTNNMDCIGITKLESDCFTG